MKSTMSKRKKLLLIKKTTKTRRKTEIKIVSIVFFGSILYEIEQPTVSFHSLYVLRFATFSFIFVIFKDRKKKKRNKEGKIMNR